MLVEPRDARANSWEDVVDLSAGFGLVLDPWQEDVFRSAMGERLGGKWAAAQVGISAPRQNGKSQMIVARALAGALLFGERLIVISAHQQDTARETFAKFLELRDVSSALAKRMPESGIMNALNREQIRLSNGAVIKFKARSGAGGRGFSSDLLMLDEAQILGARAWASINSTMSARENPQVWLLGTPPDPGDDSEVFARVRASALRGETQRLAYLEWAADPKDDPALEETRAKANPAWRTRINHDVVQGEFETYSSEQFARERLGIWDAEDAGRAALPYGNWRDSADPDAVRGADVVFGADVAEDRTAWVAVAWTRPDGAVQVQLVQNEPRPAHELVGWCVELGERWDGTFVAPAAFEESLKAEGLRVEKATSAEFAAACGSVFDRLTGGTLKHGNQSALNAAVKAARWRPVGSEGARAFQLKDIPEVGPLAAATRALHGLATITEGVLVW